MKRLIVAVIAVGGALLLQLTIINGLPLPGGGAPDLVLLCVVAIGLVAGPRAGIVTGFCAGLALDVAPPANELIGQYALVLCLAGYCSGRLTSMLRRSPVLALAGAAGVIVAGELLSACLVLVLDTPQATLTTVARVLPSAVVYDIAVSPLVMFAAIRIGVALGMSFHPGEDSPALETGGSARPMGLARLARLRQLRHSSIGAGGVGIGWLTGDSAGEIAPVGAVGWLNGPVTSRRARREQARLTAALTGAAPRKGAFWVGSRPPGVRPANPPGTSSPAGASGLGKLRPDTGVAGSAARAGLPVPTQHGADGRGLTGPGLPSISFSGGKTAATPSGRASSDVPKIAFGTGGLPRSGRASRQEVPKIAFGTGGTAGAGRAAGRGVPKIGFGSGGLPRGPRTSPGRPALPRFRSVPSASGQWLAGSEAGRGYVSSALPLRRRRFGSGKPGKGPARQRRRKTAKLRRRGITRWLPWLRRPGGRSATSRISRNLGGER
ncbi:MAG TPA: rod shape-determining protein MreD [Streptosporangiaceae bacterium]|nr:rod shape-determining protein MreD [Streptosporangiaceae bacterium]